MGGPFGFGHQHEPGDQRRQGAVTIDDEAGRGLA